MRFIHSTIVGHFDPCTLSPFDRETKFPIDIAAAERLLSEFPAHVADQIAFRDGYAECWWADGSIGFSAETHEYANRLAETLNCVAAETPMCYVTYPEHAKRIQADAWEEWRRRNPTPPRAPSVTAVFDPPKPAPCPYCGELLRTSIARQCRHCKMDWHDPQNIFRRSGNRG